MKTLKGFIVILTLVTAASLTVSAQVSLSNIDGGRVDVEAQSGKVVVLAIGASWLPLSGKQAEFTNKLARKYTGKNVVVYFVATDSSNVKSKNYASVEGLRRFSTTNKLGVPILHDPDGVATRKKFKIDQVPSFIILDKNGNLAGEQFGGITTDTTYDVTAPIIKVVDRLL